MSYRNKKHYHQPQKHWNSQRLEPGQKGFLCTCNDQQREKDCIREAYNLLNEFADLLYGPPVDSEKPEGSQEPEGSNEKKEDIDAELDKELKDLKKENKQNKWNKRFQSVQSGAKAVVFIKTTLPDPAQLAHNMLSTVAETKQQKSKFLLRLLPVEATCKAFIEDIVETCSPLLDQYFKQKPVTFSVVYNHRNNNSLDRDRLIEVLASLVFTKNPEHKANLKEPELVILVEVIKSICCLSVVRDYYKFKKYNLIEVASIKPEQTTKEVSEGEVPKNDISDVEEAVAAKEGKTTTKEVLQNETPKTDTSNVEVAAKEDKSTREVPVIETPKTDASIVEEAAAKEGAEATQEVD